MRQGTRGGEKGIGGREGFFPIGGRASGGAGPEWGLPVRALVEVVVGHGLRLGVIELRALVYPSPEYPSAPIPQVKDGGWSLAAPQRPPTK